jgi:hypothetical protein
MNDAYGNTKFNRIAQGNGAIATAGNKTIAVLIGIMGQRRIASRNSRTVL